MLPLSQPLVMWTRRGYNCKHISYHSVSAEQRNAHCFIERMKCHYLHTVFLSWFFLVNSPTNGNFFHRRQTHLHTSHAFVFQSPPIIHMLDIINMPMHSTAFSPSPLVSLWSIRGSDLAGAPCINNCMNITMLSVLFCVTLSWGRTEMLWDVNLQCLRLDIGATDQSIAKECTWRQV